MQLANHIAKEENFSQNILQGCNMSTSVTEQQQPYDKKKKPRHLQHNLAVTPAAVGSQSA